MENITQLVKAMQTGDQSAYEKLYEISYQDIYYFILKTVKEKELAEDLTQDTFIRIYENISSLTDPQAYVAWSRQIAYHGCTAYFRKRKELLADENEDGSTVFDTVTEENAEFIPHEALDREDLKKTILAMIEALPQEQRSAILLRYYEELPVSQIAKVQGVSEGTVKSRLNYGRKAIRSTVEEYEKKNGIKLHSVAILPLLLWLLRKYKLGKGESFTAGATAATGAAAATAGATGAAAGAAVGAATKGFFASAGAKIMAAVLAVTVVIGGVAGAIALGGNQEDSDDRSNKGRKPSHKEEPVYTEPVYTEPVDTENTSLRNTLIKTWHGKQVLHTQVETLVLTDRPVPEGAEITDCSAAGDNSVLMWIEGNTMYITTADGGTLYAPKNSAYLFANENLQGESSLKHIVFDNFDTSRTTKMYEMFRRCNSLESLDLSGWDVSHVVDMHEMFRDCVKLQTVDVSTWDVSNVSNMSQMFESSSALRTMDVSSWDVSGVTDMSYMFAYCYSLEYLDVSRWDVSNVTRMSSMFHLCKQLNNLDVSGWDVSNVTQMGGMFSCCWEVETLDVSKWDVSKVTNMNSMFYACIKLETLDVSKWDVSKVTDMNNMFYGCDKLEKPDISGWNIAPDANMEDMF